MIAPHFTQIRGNTVNEGASASANETTPSLQRCIAYHMAIHFNHTILYARDSQASAKFLADILGLPAPTHWGPFEMVATANGANLDYMDTDGKVTPQHYAFLISEQEFDEIFGRH